MTADELRKLAEIAGFYGTVVSTFHNEDGAEVPIEVYLKDGKDSLPVILWQPHLRIEQAMMVAEAFDCYEIGKDMSSAAPYWCQIFTGVGGPMIGQAIGMELPYAICRAALAAKEE